MLQVPLSGYRWALFVVGVFATAAIAIAGLSTLIASQTSTPSTMRHPPAVTSRTSQTIAVEVDKPTAVQPSQAVKPGHDIHFGTDIDPKTVDHSQTVEPGHTVSVAIPDAALDKLGPSHEPSLKWLVEPAATILAAIGAAAATIITARIALSGVLKGAKDKWLDDRLDDVWQRFIWIVDSARGKLLDWNQRKTLLAGLSEKADQLEDPQLSSIIKHWFSEGAERIYNELVRSEGPSETLTSLGSPEDAIKAAKRVLRDKTLSPDIKARAQTLLDRSNKIQQGTDIGAALAAIYSEIDEDSRPENELAYYGSRRSGVLRKTPPAPTA